MINLTGINSFNRVICYLCLFLGLTAFDYIVDFEEWIECGYFNEEIKARLKGIIFG
jgi:hypothetical protein